MLQQTPPQTSPAPSPARRPPPPQPKRTYRRRRLIVSAAVVVAVAAALTGPGLWRAARHNLVRLHALAPATTLPGVAGLSPLRARIVRIAESQIGYRTDPANTYCNKYSAYWGSGPANCGNSNLDEEWCADFAAWVWQEAGASVVYQYINGDLNSSAASFYEWGVDHGTWHPRASGYVPQPGDVAVYGLDASALVAAHVAVVIAYTPGQRGPTAVNGDGDLTGFSVVEVRTDEYVADTHPSGAPLSGYVSPNPATD